MASLKTIKRSNKNYIDLYDAVFNEEFDSGDHILRNCLEWTTTNDDDNTNLIPWILRKIAREFGWDYLEALETL